MIYTACFRRVKEVLNPISIAGLTPSWVGNIPKFKKLAPSKQLVMDYKNGLISEGEYIINYYNSVLSKWPTANELVKELIKTFGDTMTLLCYEEYPGFCHRHVVGKFINTQTGIIVNEYNVK